MRKEAKSPGVEWEKLVEARRVPRNSDRARVKRKRESEKSHDRKPPQTRGTIKRNCPVSPQRNTRRSATRSEEGGGGRERRKRRHRPPAGGTGLPARPRGKRMRGRSGWTEKNWSKNYRRNEACADSLIAHRARRTIKLGRFYEPSLGARATRKSLS